MPYIPEHRFEGNLYTNGGEYSLLSSGKEYQGFYHKLSSGKFFTGKTPYNNITQELILLTDSSTENNENASFIRTIGKVIESPLDPIKFPYFDAKSLEQTSVYVNAFNIDTNKVYLIPTSFLSLPTPEDYVNGTFIRYLLYNTVTKAYLEVDQSTYNNIKSKNPEWDYFNYQAFILPWRISGTKKEIIKTNTKMIVAVSRDNNLPLLSSYIVDLCEYSKTKSDQDIFTYSITYQNMEGASTIPTPYNPPTDDFHIMPDGTIMPGKTHEEYLKTIAPSIATQTSSSITAPTPTSTPSIPNNISRGGY